MTRIMNRASWTFLGMLLALPVLAAPEKPRVAVLVFEYEGGATRVEASGIADWVFLPGISLEFQLAPKRICPPPLLSGGPVISIAGYFNCEAMVSARAAISSSVLYTLGETRM